MVFKHCIEKIIARQLAVLSCYLKEISKDRYHRTLGKGISDMAGTSIQELIPRTKEMKTVIECSTPITHSSFIYIFSHQKQQIIKRST